jgi:fatty-acyl-CoA synthase
VIKTGGEWLSSLDLENLISQHPAVSAAAVVGVADEKWGERPHALIMLKPGQNATQKDIQAHLQRYVDKGEINKWAIPRQMDFVDDIPKTSVGKINKKQIRDQLG